MVLLYMSIDIVYVVSFSGGLDCHNTVFVREGAIASSGTNVTHKSMMCATLYSNGRTLSPRQLNTPLMTHRNECGVLKW